MLETVSHHEQPPVLEKEGSFDDYMSEIENNINGLQAMENAKNSFIDLGSLLEALTKIKAFTEEHLSAAPGVRESFKLAISDFSINMKTFSKAYEDAESIGDLMAAKDIAKQMRTTVSTMNMYIERMVEQVKQTTVKNI